MPAPNADVFGDRSEFRVTWDPDLAKGGKKGKLQAKYFTSKLATAIKNGDPLPTGTSQHIDAQFKSDSVTDSSSSSKPNLDPRDAASNKKRYLKRVPYQGLPVPRLSYDQDWVADKPTTKILVSELSSLTTRGAVKAAFESFGPIEECQLILNPHTAMSLGSCHVKFGGSISKAHQAAKDALRSKTHVDMKLVKVEFDENGQKAAKLVASIPAAVLPKTLAKPPPKPIANGQTLAKEKLDRRDRDLERDRERERERRDRDEKDRRSHPMSPAVARIVVGRPYLFISDKYVPTNEVYPSDIKRMLQRYPWDRVICDDFGFYVIFGTPRDARRCFDEMDGRRLFGFRVIMKLVDVPSSASLSSSYTNGNSHRPHNDRHSGDPVTGATRAIIQELKTLLLKDIRQRVIVPRIFDGLKATQKMMNEKKINGSNITSAVSTPLTGGSLTPVSASGAAPSSRSIAAPKVVTEAVTGLDVTKIRLPKFKRKNARPMTHQLNFAQDEDEDEDEERNAEIDNELEEDDDEPIQVKKEQTKNKQRRIKLEKLDWSSDEEEEEREGTEVETKMETEDFKEIEKSPTPQVGNLDWRPSVGPQPTNVCNEAIADEDSIDFVDLQKLVIDDEDYKYLKAALGKSVGDCFDKPQSMERVSELTSHLASMHIAIRQEQKQIDLLVGDDKMLGAMMAAKWDATPHSRRSMGYFYVPEAAKFEYMPHRRRIQQKQNSSQSQSTGHGSSAQTSNVKTSRSNRASNRRFAAELNLQKQMVSVETDVFNFNQLKKRKKPVKFARSAIHNWGLYAVEPITANEMIIEYVGEVIRAPLADLRERNYQRAGIGSSYLFRIDDTVVVDATKKGGIARFINHCCAPSCTAKIIKVEGEKRIVIYALRNIGANEELTYDYKFERELGEERIPCLCGSPACKGFLN